LQVLSLDAELWDIDGLLSALGAGGHHLSTLSLGYVRPSSWSQLTGKLPDVVHLREIHLEHVLGTRCSSMDFVRAMKKNGSLHEVSCKTSQHTPLFCAEELQRIRIYCQRNRLTRQMLQNPSLPCDDTGDGHAETWLSLFPALFAILKPAKRTHPNSIFVGLTRCSGNSIGPQGQVE
jgi:hypothetical protein